MTDPAALHAIGERLKAATGADRELDRQIEGLDPAQWMTTPPYTASIDAAVGVVERVLPGCSLKTWSPHFVAAVGSEGCWGEAAGETLSLAILSALVNALAALAQHKETRG